MNKKPRRPAAEGRTNQAIAERLELTRTVLGLTQKEFAERAKINQNTYSQCKAGTNAPNLEQAHKLCDAWHLTLDWIYRGDTSGLDPDMAAAITVVRNARHAR